jgi:23S rRNA G2445 N2-methylase RlmL
MFLCYILYSHCAGARALVVSGNKEALNVLRMRPSQKYKLTVGGVEAHMYQYQVLPPKQQ